MTQPSYLLMAFDAENQPVLSHMTTGDLLQLDQRAHNVLMLRPEVEKVLIWLIDGRSFIDRQAQPVVDVKLPWVE